MTDDQAKQQETGALALLVAQSEAKQFIEKYHAALELLAEHNGHDTYHWNSVVAAKTGQKPGDLTKHCPRCGFNQGSLR